MKKELQEINTKVEAKQINDEEIKTEEIVIEDTLDAIEEDDFIKIDIKRKKKKTGKICYFCNLCDFQSDTKRELNNHKFFDHEENFCNECGKKFSEYRDLKKHMDSFHANLNCSYCGKIFMNRHKLKSHEWNHLNRETGPLKEKTSSKKETSGFCNICGKFMLNVDAHIKQIHERIYLKNQELMCKICGLHSKTKNDLEKHMKYSHEATNPEPCPYCGKEVKRLDIHLKRNKCDLPENERFPKERVKCEQCGKDFSSPHSLSQHIKKIHLNQKNEKCEQCDYRTYTKSNLYMHVKRMHEGRSLKVECVHCNKMCVNIEWHLKMYHNGIINKE